MTLILCEDMDWAVGSERSTVAPVTKNARGASTTHVMERTYERVDGYVLPVEEVRGSPGPPRRLFVAPATAPIAKPVTYVPFRTRYAWELNPDLDDSIFDPNRYLADPLTPPPARPFPWWLVTLALGCGLGLFLVVRKGGTALRSGRSRIGRPEAA